MNKNKLNFSKLLLENYEKDRQRFTEATKSLRFVPWERRQLIMQSNGPEVEK